MNRSIPIPIPIMIIIYSVSLFMLSLQELIKKLTVAYKIKLLS